MLAAFNTFLTITEECPYFSLCHFFSPNASGSIRTLDLKIMRQVCYYCAIWA